MLLDGVAMIYSLVDVEEQCERDGPDSSGSWIVLLVLHKLPL